MMINISKNINESELLDWSFEFRIGLNYYFVLVDFGQTILMHDNRRNLPVFGLRFLH